MNQAVPENKDLFEHKRAALGVCALLCFLLALAIYVIAPENRGVLLAGSIRVGIVLTATWLALPQLRGMLAKLPAMIPAVALLLIIVCAARPNLFRIIGTLVVVGGGLTTVSKWIQTLSPKSRP